MQLTDASEAAEEQAAAAKAAAAGATATAEAAVQAAQAEAATAQAEAATAQAEVVAVQAEAATAQAAAVRAAAVTTQAQMEVEEVEAETPASIYACCTSQSNTAVWQCNVCRLWFHNGCMKKKGDSANPLCESCLTAATEKGPRAKRGRAE